MGSAAVTSGRVNQKARTRAALVDATVELVREGRPPSIPDVADRARISVATAYRYFPSADELWFEASEAAESFTPKLQAASERIDQAGDDPAARLAALVESVNYAMVDDPAVFRRLAKGAIERWFEQVDVPLEERAPTRQGRRRAHIEEVLAPLRDHLATESVERIARALTIVVGTEAMLAVVDSAQVDGDAAKETMLDGARWMLSGALAELGVLDSG